MTRSEELPTSSRRWTAVLGVALLAILVVLLFRTMNRDLNHDEHQFLAPGALLSREGLLPYRDYPLFHLPNLVFLYAAGDWLTGSPIFSAKLLSFACSAGMLCLLAWYGRKTGAYRPWMGVVGGLSAALLLFFDPVFYYTAGKMWNHEVPSFLILLSIALQAFAVPRGAKWLAALSGLAAGFAVGTRLTFAPILLPICIIALFAPSPWRSRLALMVSTGLGVAAGLLPSLVLYLQSPQNFVFGNLEFPRLRLLDPENTRIQKTMRLSAKLRYFFKDVVVPSLPLFLAYGTLGVRPAWKWLRRQEGGSLGAALVLAALPFALAGCFAPSRYQYQHYFGVTCLLALGVAFGIQQIKSPRLVLGLAATVVLSAVIALNATDKRQQLTFSFAPPQEWFAAKARRIGEKIKTYAPVGPVLTLAPTWPLEAGLTIYPEFATGPFGWRSAPYVSEQKRAAAHLIAPVDLSKLLETRPPAAILTGVEDAALEEPLLAYAKEHQWRRVPLSRKRELWLPPE